MKSELHNTDILYSRRMAVYDSSVTVGIKLAQGKDWKEVKNERKPLVKFKDRPIEHESRQDYYAEVFLSVSIFKGRKWQKTTSEKKATVTQVRNSKCRGAAQHVCSAFTSVAFEA